MPLPQMTTRRWMIAVAVMAVGLAAIPRAYEHNWQCRSRAFGYRICIGHLAKARVERRTASGLADEGEDVGIEWFKAMERKYRLAAWMPWLLLWPDPLEPF